MSSLLVIVIYFMSILLDSCLVSFIPYFWHMAISDAAYDSEVRFDKKDTSGPQQLYSLKEFVD